MSFPFLYNINTRRAFFIQGKIEINYTKEKIWHIITQPGHLENYHPYCKKHIKTTSWKQIGDTDQGFFYSGKSMKREVIDWQEEKSYKVKIDNDDENLSEVKFSIESKTTEISIFTIEIFTDSYKKIPRPIWYFFAFIFLVPSYKKYLNSILKGLKYYSETGKKVSKNQFGSHKIFSP
ncbi:hypothetical protein [Mesonia aquimarina]|uniref:hypothetical protein n=1 Tax=Mesonia aquimarina TaxID=1504967 RepID=UPI000EF5FDC6|nr:hypothetical protein [Mesonia aquimarina]